jgi:hypothetical protein
MLGNDLEKVTLPSGKSAHVVLGVELYCRAHAWYPLVLGSTLRTIKIHTAHVYFLYNE